MPKIQSNGINLYYEVNGQGQPLLFVHRLGSSARDWELQVKEFSKTYSEPFDAALTDFQDKYR